MKDTMRAPWLLWVIVIALAGYALLLTTGIFWATQQMVLGELNFTVGVFFFYLKNLLVCISIVVMWFGFLNRKAYSYWLCALVLAIFIGQNVSEVIVHGNQIVGGPFKIGGSEFARFGAKLAVPLTILVQAFLLGWLLFSKSVRSYFSRA